MAKRIDANQPEIVDALRRVGAVVQSLAELGRGCPDLLVAFRGDNYLMEVKDGSKPPSARQLTADEAAWHGRWKRAGQVEIVESVNDALRVIGATR
jgi:hypothetical protein